MSDPMDAIRETIQSVHPQWSAPVTPIRPEAASCPTAVQFTPPPAFEDDDLQAAGDDYRDRLDGWCPDPSELC